MCSEVSRGLYIYRKGVHVAEGSGDSKHVYCQDKLCLSLMINRRRSQSDSQAIGVSRPAKPERALLISQRRIGSNHLRHATESVRTSRFSNRARESCCNFYGSIAAGFCCTQCDPLWLEPSPNVVSPD